MIILPTPLFLAGMLCAGHLVVALFFLRFWRETRDRLFVFFALAFAIFAAERVVLAVAAAHDRSTSLIYLMRFAATVVLIAGIIDKNRTSAE